MSPDKDTEAPRGAGAAWAKGIGGMRGNNSLVRIASPRNLRGPASRVATWQLAAVIVISNVNNLSKCSINMSHGPDT